MPDGPLFNAPEKPHRSPAVDMSRSFTRTSIIIAVLIVVGWFSTSTNLDELIQNSWMLLLLLLPLIAYFLLRSRVRDMPPIEETS